MKLIIKGGNGQIKISADKDTEITFDKFSILKPRNWIKLKVGSYYECPRPKQCTELYVKDEVNIQINGEAIKDLNNKQN